MIRHVWSVLCSKAVIDRTSNNVSLFEVLEAVQFTTNVELKFPANVQFEGTIVTLWTKKSTNTPVTAQMRSRLLSPTGEELASLPQVINLQTATRTRILTVLKGLCIAGNGTHEFEISWRLTDSDPWVPVASLPLELTINVDPTPPQTETA